MKDQEIQFLGYAPVDATIMEMNSEGSDGGINVPVDQSMLQQVSEGDTDPMFVTIEVLNEGVSRNGRHWTRELMASVAEQINRKKPDGFLGHLSNEERNYKHPEVQTIWLGATVKDVQGKARLFAKGYVLPSAGWLRTYLSKAKKLGKNVAVSVYGTAVESIRNGVAALANFDLESIDWARSGSEGVRNIGLFAVTSEMTGGVRDVNKEEDVNKEDILKSATASELKTLNPTVVQEITQDQVGAKEATRPNH